MADEVQLACLCCKGAGKIGRNVGGKIVIQPCPVCAVDPRTNAEAEFDLVK